MGAKTIDLINQNVHVEAVRDDLEALVLDAAVLDSISSSTIEAANALKLAGRIPSALVPTAL